MAVKSTAAWTAVARRRTQVHQLASGDHALHPAPVRGHAREVGGESCAVGGAKRQVLLRGDLANCLIGRRALRRETAF